MSDLLTFSADVKLEAAQGDGDKPASVRIEAYDGGTMTVAPFGEVVVDRDALEIPDSVPLLSDHDTSRQNVVGAGKAVVASDGSIEVTGNLSRATAAGREIIGLHADGVPWQSSIGVTVDPRRTEKLRPGQTAMVNGRTFTAGPRGLTIIRGRLKEVSILVSGASKHTAVDIAATDSPVPKRKPQMEPEFSKWLKANGHTDDSIAALPDDAVTHLKAMWSADQSGDDASGDEFETMIARNKASRERQRQITEIVEREAKQHPDQLDRLEAMGEIALKAGTDPMKFELEVLREMRPVGPPNAPRGRTGGETGQVLEAAIAQTLGFANLEKLYSEQVLEAADKEFHHGIGLQQVLFRAAAVHGQHYDSVANVRGLLEASFGRTRHGEVMQAAGGHSTFSLPGIFQNVLNKGLSAYWDSVENVWSRITATRSTNDYKEVKNYALVGGLEFEEIPPSGQIPHGTLDETSYSNRAKMHGKLLGLSHEDIINDDLGALDAVRQHMGRGGHLALNRVFWTAFLNNATFFTTGTGSAVEGADTNLSGADPVAALDKAETAFRKQVGPDGEPISVAPRIMLVPPTQANRAAALMGSQRVVTGAAATLPDANVYAGRYRVESSVYMENTNYTGNSSLAWYLLADPMDLPVIQVVWLRGQRMPRVESADCDFDELGVRVRGTFPFGVAKQEYRGGVRAKGAA